MNGKQRAFLRSISNSMDCTFQIGKNGISDNVIKQFDELLAAKEIIKTNVLKTCDESPKEVANKVAQATEGYIVSVVGRKFVMYKKSIELEAEEKGLILPS